MWRELTPEALAREYSPSSTALDFQGTLAQYRRRSDDALQRLHAPSIVRYGSANAERVMLFEAPAAAGGRPAVLVYFHGGYWQALSAEDACFPARDLLPQGMSYAAQQRQPGQHAADGRHQQARVPTMAGTAASLARAACRA